jgi:hypothetical protein
MNKPTKSIREEIENEVGEFYFTHCKPEARPKFRTAAEVEAWNKAHLFGIESIVRITSETLLSLFKEYARGISEEVIGEDVEADEDMFPYDQQEAINREKREQRAKLEELLEQK